MKVLTLRARLPDARPTHLHQRITVLSGLNTADREALLSTFAALTTETVPGLEAVLEVNGATVPLDESFARTHELLEALPCVIEVPATAASVQQDPNPAAVARLRAKSSALASELAIIERNLAEEELTATDPGNPRRARAGDPAQRPSQTARELADQLAVALGRPMQPEPGELADRLEEIALRRGSMAAREAALSQLMAECRVAIDSVQEAISSGTSIGDPYVDAVAQLDAVRDEMISLAVGSMSRRDRRRLAELRSREQAILASTGFTTYSDLAAEASARSGGGGDQLAYASARLDLLHELEGFWSQLREQSAQDRAEEAELLAQAEDLLGEPLGTQRTPRLVAVRLRSIRPQEALRSSSVEHLAGRLAAELGLDDADSLTPREVLELAEMEFDAAEDPAAPPAHRSTADRSAYASRTDPSHNAAIHTWRGSDRTDELMSDARRVRAELEQVESRLTALERTGAFGASTPGSRPGGRDEVDPPSWSLPGELELRRPMPYVGSMPALIIEPESGPTALDGADVPTIVAMASRRQIVWVTERPEVISAMEMLGNMGSTIIV